MRYSELIGKLEELLPHNRKGHFYAWMDDCHDNIFTKATKEFEECMSPEAAEAYYNLIKDYSLLYRNRFNVGTGVMDWKRTKNEMEGLRQKDINPVGGDSTPYET